jgi:hypothetical protein
MRARGAGAIQPPHQSGGKVRHDGEEFRPSVSCMKLQRWSGLSLVDAACLAKGELIEHQEKFRVTTERRKTGTHINNVIPEALGREMPKVKNGNQHHLLISGEATPKGAVTRFDKQYRKAFTKAQQGGRATLGHAPAHVRRGAV